MLNSDGIDIDCCQHVTVSDCIINSGDDSITIRCAGKRLKNSRNVSEYITISNCVLHSAICAFRFGVGIGNIRHVRISNITVSRSRELFQFCTAYLDIGCACIEDLYINNVSATDTDRAISMFANNGSYVKDVCIENVRSTACSMSYIHANNGVIDNIRIKNFEICVFDRYESLDDETLNMRGHHVFSAKNVSRLRLEDVKIFNDFKQRKEKIIIENCNGLIQKECNFDT